MKLIANISDITHEDLVNLISTACYGSPWLDFQYESLSPADTIEDAAACILLSGGTVEFIDAYAEEPDEVYSETARFESDAAIYPITLEDIRNGLEKAFSGQFKANDEDEKSWANVCALHLLYEDSTFDAAEADCLMQIIMFGEVIYG